MNSQCSVGNVKNNVSTALGICNENNICLAVRVKFADEEMFVRDTEGLQSTALGIGNKKKVFFAVLVKFANEEKFVRVTQRFVFRLVEKIDCITSQNKIYT